MSPTTFILSAMKSGYRARSFDTLIKVLGISESIFIAPLHVKPWPFGPGKWFLIGSGNLFLISQHKMEYTIGTGLIRAFQRTINEGHPIKINFRVWVYHKPQIGTGYWQVSAQSENVA